MILKSLRLSSLLFGLMAFANPAQAAIGDWVQETALGLEQHMASLERSSYRVDNHTSLSLAVTSTAQHRAS